jgi:prevent-host-death family protein
MKEARVVPAGEFKAHCLRLLDEVQETGEELIITKRGRPVARVLPAHEPEAPSLVGSILWEGDLIAPIEADWTATG